ncbi:MAG: hypothetical protein WDO16_17090 [Bacteroidota bacterium]
MSYSQTPHIYDDTFNFKLENYIVPDEIEANTQKRKKGETLFFFPFNHKAKSKEDAYKEIEEKLEHLFQRGFISYQPAKDSLVVLQKEW